MNRFEYRPETPAQKRKNEKEMDKTLAVKRAQELEEHLQAEALRRKETGEDEIVSEDD